MTMKIDIEYPEIKIKVLKNPKIFGVATIKLYPLTIHGFLILPSQYQNEKGELLRVKPPQYKGSDNKWHLLIFIEDKQCWKRLESKILDEYQKAKKLEDKISAEQLSEEENEKIAKEIYLSRTKKNSTEYL